MVKETKIKPRHKILLEKNRPVLSLKGVSSFNILCNISFEIYPGEVVGIIGLNGSGKKELTQLLFGLIHNYSGIILLNNRRYQPGSPREAIDEGVFLAPEDRRTQGLQLDFEVYKNFSLPFMTDYKNIWGLSKQKEFEAAERMAQKINLKGPGLTLPTKKLSGGNQEKVVIGKWLQRKPKVMILDEPTVGMDIRSKNEITNIISDLADQGSGVLYLSSNIEEVRNISDRLLILHQGRLIQKAAHLNSENEILSQILSSEYNE